MNSLLHARLVISIFTVLWCTHSATAEWHFREHEIFGTNVSVQLWSENTTAADRAHENVAMEMWRIHNKLSPYIETSELALLNQNAYAEPLDVSDELATLIDKALFYSEISSGAFDITFASLGHLFDYREAVKPTQGQIEALTKSINYRLIRFDKTSQTIQFSNPNVRIDLGGIAKGYAVDQAVRILTDQGIEHAAISAGGDSRMLGDKRGEPWIVGIKNPRSAETAIRIPLENFSISTSGDYERFFIDPDSGERVHHILNPSTGSSAGELTSVSVIGPHGFDTDPLSTTLFVLGKEKGLALIEEFDDFDAIIIDLQGKVHFSSGLEPPE